jgi:hypothetical protein
MWEAMKEILKNILSNDNVTGKWKRKEKGKEEKGPMVTTIKRSKL